MTDKRSARLPAGDRARRTTPADLHQLVENPAHLVFFNQVALFDKLIKRLYIRIDSLLPLVFRHCLFRQSSLHRIARDTQKLSNLS